MAGELKIRPLGDKIVVKVIEETETTPGGIFISVDDRHSCSGNCAVSL
jgi:co-chaperonin GroES (HSP10)